MKVPKNHPRYLSLSQRHNIEQAFKKGIVAEAGLVAHGRGEAFDYFLGEKTHGFSKEAIRAAAAELLLAKKPVISVNGNTTALCAEEFVRLSNELKAPIEVNLFYGPVKRRNTIVDYYKRLGKHILGGNPTAKVPHLKSLRGRVSKKGILAADVVLLAIEDGDRTEMLRQMGKKIIAIDLNPLSRTAKKANITIVDNVLRSVPLMTKEAKKLKRKSKEQLRKIVKNFNNKSVLRESEKLLRKAVLGAKL